MTEKTYQETIFSKIIRKEIPADIVYQVNWLRLFVIFRHKLKPIF